MMQNSPNQQLNAILKSGRRQSLETSYQKAVISWFRLQHPKLEKLLIHVPNGGSRSKIKVKAKNGDTKEISLEGKELKQMGATAGVADLLLLTPRQGYGCLAIEMKTEDGKQSTNQKEWQLEMIRARNKYVVCRSVQEAIEEISKYLI